METFITKSSYETFVTKRSYEVLVTGSPVFVYLAGNHNSKTTFRSDFNNLAGMHGVRGLDPFERNVEFNAANAVGRDLLLIQSSAYVVCECSKGGNMSTGTAMESVIAKSLGKKVICLMTEGEDYFPDSGTHPFTYKFADCVANSVREVVSYILSDLADPQTSQSLDEQIQSYGWTEFPEGDIDVLAA